MTLGAGASSDIETGPDPQNPGHLTLATDLVFGPTFGTPTAGSPSVNLGTKGGSIILNGGTRTFTVPDAGQLVELAIPADITGTLTGLTKDGAGTLAIGGTTTVGGATNVAAGELMVPGGGTLNTTGVNTSSGTVLSGGAGTTAGTIHLADPATGLVTVWDAESRQPWLSNSTKHR